MKQTLQLKLSQHLTLTPQLQQSIRLLQLSTLELNQEIERFLSDNPMLEREDTPGGDEGSSPTPTNDHPQEAPERPESAAEDNSYDGSELSDWSSDSGGSRKDDDDDSDYRDIQAATASLRDHLVDQLGLTPLSDRDRSLVRLLIEALDDDGYLTQDLEELHAMLPPELEVDPEELHIALHHLQHMDPPGVGARNPVECLELQLINLPATPVSELALAIVRKHLELLASRDSAKLKRLLRCTDEALRDAHNLIRTLNPRPGAAFGPADTRYVVPDVVVRKVRNQWVASLNGEAMPRLRINKVYADILQQHRSSSSTASLSSQLQEAKWLIKNVQQRFETILRVSQAIVDRQSGFFDHGDVAMRPLTLREIADQLGLHESTISRVTTQKYMATPRGVFELKYFFGSHVATEAGGACSATAIRALIKQLVGAEDTRKPLSDAKIAELLGQQGIVVARRTIAKYRESLNIPPVNLRKSI